MSKIIKKSDITTLVETTMKQAGILKEEEIDVDVNEADKPDYIDLDKDGDKEESMKKASKDKEEMDEACDDDMMEEEEMDIVSESTKKLAGQASEHNIISENLKKDLASFNKIINYKY
jgi:hypothetical protein